ncbi:MAG: hypothetical protein Q8R13_05600 [bacterium]|nr:hypothetical protein [bacterium]MDZ4296469.1 hypothetical protein [Patescibacteria group bacterium]
MPKEALPPAEEPSQVPARQEKPRLPALEKDTALVRKETPGLPVGIEKSQLPALQPKAPKRKVVIADTSEGAEAMARDVAESKRTKERSQLTGLTGFLKKIWQHNLANEYYRQKEIAAARGQILGSGSLYGTTPEERQAHRDTMGAIVDRFANEYKTEMIHEGEVKETLGDSAGETAAKAQIRDLVYDYAAGAINDDEFARRKRAVFNDLKQARPDVIERGDMYADNLLDIAREIKTNVEHGERLRAEDLDFEIIVGKAKAGVRTEAQYSRIDRVIERVNRSRLGTLANETTVALGLSIAYSVATQVSRKALSSRIFALASLGGTAALAATIAGYRKSKEMEDKRRQHFREMAQGKAFDPHRSPERKTFEELRYETENAQRLLMSLDQNLYRLAPDGTKEVRDDLTEAQLRTVVGNLAEIESRIELSDKHNIDLISYSDIKSVDKERFDLDLARAKAKVDLANLERRLGGRMPLPQGVTLDELLRGTRANRVAQLINGDEGMEKKEAAFRWMKAKRVGLAAAQAGIGGIIIGSAFQEAMAFAREGQEGLLEAAGRGPEHNYTFAEWFRRWWSNELPAGGAATARVDQIVGDTQIRCPEGTGTVQNPDGSFTVTRHGQALIENIKIDANGNIPDDVRDELSRRGIIFRSGITTITDPDGDSVMLDAKGYIENRKDLTTRIARDSWYHQNSPHKPIENALRLWWGGVSGNGINAGGQYEFDVTRMTPGGSYNEQAAIDAQKLIHSGGAKLLLSLTRETQKDVFAVPIDPNGKIRIDPDSAIGKLFFSQNAKGKAVFLGRFAEVVHFTGEDKNGEPLVRILATHEGKGVDSIPDIIERPPRTIPWFEVQPCPEPPIQPGPDDTIVQPSGDYVVEPSPILPFVGRRPLEPTLEGQLPARRQEPRFPQRPGSRQVAGPAERPRRKDTQNQQTENHQQAQARTEQERPGQQELGTARQRGTREQQRDNRENARQDQTAGRHRTAESDRQSTGTDARQTRSRQEDQQKDERNQQRQRRTQEPQGRRQRTTWDTRWRERIDQDRGLKPTIIEVWVSKDLGISTRDLRIINSLTLSKQNKEGNYIVPDEAVRELLLAALGIKDGNELEIKRSYRQRMRQWHPDLQSGKTQNEKAANELKAQVTSALYREHGRRTVAARNAA